MSLTKERRAELRAIAEKASPGPWYWGEHWLLSPSSDALLWYKIDDNGIHSEPQDAAHIAAFDPLTVIALLDDLARARDDAARMRGALRDVVYSARDGVVMVQWSAAANLVEKLPQHAEAFSLALAQDEGGREG